MRSLLLAPLALCAALVAAPVSAPAADAEATITAADRDGFIRWRNDFRREALSKGISARVFDDAFRGVQLNPKIIKFDRRQPEFSRPIWKYLESAVSDSRVKNGREKLAKHRDILPGITAKYRVDPAVVLAIWGLESAYGSYYGDYSIIESLATLAYDGRRAKFAKEQLIAALKIIQAGDIPASRMKGSWAGAMGHTQFIPTSFLAYAVDFTQDGRRDLWSDDPSDALASAANYLARHGWRFGEPAYAVVRLPQGVDYFQLSEDTKRPAAYWAGLGITLADGRPLPDLGEMSVIAPAGARGPAFATFHNFNVIRRYNNAASYALGVAHLAERISGAGPMRVNWPEGDRPLGRSEKKALQENLTRMGFDTGGVDGMLGPNSRKAMRAFQRSRGMPADGYASKALLERIEAARAGRETLGSPQIMAIQSGLNARGFDAGPVDGVLGSRTRTAIVAFQAAAGVPPDGKPSIPLLRALGGAN